ncbi:HipA family kinase [Leucothrix pacifica]|uniref:HipA-like kinase domain-containing protein n=1 Tax=Leucothrix pacifica TaxID=1247513 RepID=A0A317C0C8_9GAMM|nr:HipA family kinase [Leucothrix pacifica]PWQ92105.1 hypothetical protein DKW60_22885 [Leucothrix pacifica]
MTVTIEEVIRRSDQGMTEPFICRGDDKQTYFVKGIATTRRSQLSEWIAGNLGLALGLPIAPFEIVEIPEELIISGSSLKLSDLGSGYAFGSQLKADAIELTVSNISDVPAAIQQDVLVFDWWVKNKDRMLTQQGGNPNLLWQPESKELVVIDQNQAFDSDFDETNFADLHVFSRQWSSIFGDLLKPQQYNERFEAALADWDKICDAIPEEWFYIDPEMTIPVDFELDLIYQLLKQYETDDFWTL